MWDFLVAEEGSLVSLCKHTWQVMIGKYAMIEINGVQYHIRIDPDHTELVNLDNVNDRVIVPTVKFKAYLEMFRI